MKLILKGGHVIDPANGIDQVADVLIEDGKIAQVGTDITAEGAEIKDVTGKVVAPGFIDLHMHLREPGLEAKEDMQTATQAAAAGGFTTISCMPNTKPVVDSLVLVNGLKQRAQEVGITKVQVIGAVSKGQKGEELAELGDMCQAGVMAFSDDGHYVNNSNLFMNALDYVVPFGKRIISHAEVHSLVKPSSILSNPKDGGETSQRGRY
ncbi:MAG: amidohydrolase family protein [Selenomonadales bacterium]|nr:amidohydrolase family protein [Selenomonadales bacterium]